MAKRAYSGRVRLIGQVSTSKNVRIRTLVQLLARCSELTENTEGDLFIILWDAVVSNPEKIGHGRDGFYFGENGEHLWYDISKAIGKALVKRGISKSDEPTPFTTEELVKYFGSEVSSLRSLVPLESHPLTSTL